MEEPLMQEPHVPEPLVQEPLVPGAGGAQSLSLSSKPEGGAGGERRAGRAEAEALRRPSNRALTIIIVLTTLLAALGGFLLNRASAASSDNADIAQQLSLQGASAQTTSYQQAETDYAQYLSMRALQSKASQLLFEAGYNQPGTQDWAELYRTAQAQAAAAKADVPRDLRPNLSNGNPDPSFPTDFFAARAAQGTMLSASSDAYDDVANQWSAMVDKYTAMLTIIAVALFLFGSAYVLFGRTRLLFTGLAGTLVLLATAWGTTLVVSQEPPKPSASAAKFYAQGVVALSSASTPAQYEPAIEDFTKAIAARPDFAQAYAERSNAEVGRGSLEIGSGFVSNVAPHWQALSAADALAAYQLGDTTASKISDVAWNYYYDWLIAGAHGAPPAEAAALDRQAIDADPQNPVQWMNLGIVDLAAGRYSQAMEEYRGAAQRILFLCSGTAADAVCKTPQPSSAYSMQLNWLSGGLQDLADLGATTSPTSALGKGIEQARTILVASVPVGRVETGTTGKGFRITDMAGFVDPNYLELDVGLPSGTSYQQFVTRPMVVVWYQRPVGAKQWNTISNTTCWQYGSSFCSVQDPEFPSVAQFKTQFLVDDNECFTNVQYKAELYVDGRLAGSTTLGPADTYITTNLSPAIAADMNTGACVPSSWKLQPTFQASVQVNGSSQRLTGPLTGSELSYASADRQEGIYMLRLYPLRTFYQGGAKAITAMEAAVGGEAVRLMGGTGLAADMSITTAYAPHSLPGDGAKDDGFHDMVTAVYKSPSTGQAALVGVGIASPGVPVDGATKQDRAVAADLGRDYAVEVEIVYGRIGSSFWDGAHPLGAQVFGSWALLSYG